MASPWIAASNVPGGMKSQYSAGPLQQPQPSYGAAGQMLMGPNGTLRPGMGMATSPEKRMMFPAQQRVSFIALLACVFVPWLVFAVVLFARAMWLRFNYPWLSMGLAIYFLIFVGVVGVMAFSAARDSNSGRGFSPSSYGDARTLGLAFVLCASSWAAAFFFGDYIFMRFTQPYYDLTNLNSYPSVDPVKYNGKQLMDAGIIDFVKGAKLDLTKSIGFKDSDVYCVAPITMKGGKQPSNQTIDFWAIGMNCCSGHQPDFHCGEYNMPEVHKGLRLMQDDQRQFFRLAVKEAEAAYNIEAKNPIFLWWLADPVSEVEAYQDDANWYFMFGVSGSFSVLVVTVMFWTIIMHVVSK